MRQHIQVEYKDGSFQWIKYSDRHLIDEKNIKRISAFCSGDISVDTRRWKKIKNKNFGIEILEDKYDQSFK